MKTSDFDFHLPESSIAQFPADRRDGSRLLHLPLSDDPWADRVFTDLPEILASKGAGLIVINDTKVLPARLFGRKATGGKVEILLLHPTQDPACWTAMGKSSKGLKVDTEIFAGDSSVYVEQSKGDGRYLLRFKDETEAKRLMESYGVMPLPPYIHRETGGDQMQQCEDKKRYQTVYAQHEGAVAAPTAGLHFTPEILNRLSELGIDQARVTLHVGEGTFLPVRTDDILEHPMHTEWYEILPDQAEKINRTKTDGLPLIAVGTTSLRTLEAAADEKGIVKPGAATTDIFIYPGYHFKCINGLLTNFHLPRSTLLMLVAALAGRERILAAYEHAVSSGYRFYSYGDAMLLL